VPRCLLLGRGEVVVKLLLGGRGLGAPRRGVGGGGGEGRGGGGNVGGATEASEAGEAEAAEVEVVGAAGAGAAEAASREWGSVATTAVTAAWQRRPRLTAKPRAIRIIGASLGAAQDGWLPATPRYI